MTNQGIEAAGIAKAAGNSNRKKRNSGSYMRFGRLAVVVAALGLAGCNAGPLLTTGSLSAKPATVPKVSTPLDRAMHMGATSARAQKCGYYFDAVALRSNFLAAETQRGATPDVIAKISQAYDYTAKSIAAKIADAEAYCTKERNAMIKAALQGALAGNYEPPVVKQAAKGSGWADWFDGPAKPDKFDPNSIYDPLLNDPNKKQ